MKAAGPRQETRQALELVEEAAHLLRQASAAVWAFYYFGSLPFVLALLYYWADMSRNPFASLHLTEAALGVAACFLWMKWWHALFALRVRGLAAAEPGPALTVNRAGRIFVIQAALHPLGLFLLPLGLLPIFSFPWVFSFFQNANALASREAELGTVFRKAWQQTAFWPRQTFLLVLVLFAFGAGVFLNWTTVGYLLPALARMLFGVESAFSRSGTSLLNTTFFAVTLGLTYLCVDPLIKTVYTLRCFYVESLRTGADLQAELKQASMAFNNQATAILALAILLCFAPAQTYARSEARLPSGADGRVEAPSSSQPNAAPTAPPATVSGPALEQAIAKVIQQPKFSWRMPREARPKLDETEKGVVARFFERASALVRKWLHTAWDWLEEWLRKLFSRERAARRSPGGYGWMVWSQVLLYGLTLLAVIGLAALVGYILRERRKQSSVVKTEALKLAPDLADENVGPEQLPEDGWAKLARELIGRGELRLALRAWYLASLTHLAGRNLLTLARFKSNREYECELGRRAHAFPDLSATFGENVSLFDRVWYGWHEINLELVNRFAANVERIKSSVSSS